MAEDWQSGGFGLYLHWPFCAAKCPYCDFNSHVSKTIDHDAWRDAYLAELDRYAALTSGRTIQTVYFGGGTPSLMEPSVVDAILDHIHRRWPMANDPEITLEANPGSVDTGRFQAFASAGVNRVSMGFQALNERDLTRLGRLHSVDDAFEALEIANTFFDRTSFDLIYARQNQSLSDWQAELTRALEMGTDHLSLYQLTIEPGTAFGDRFRAGRLSGLPHDDLSADMYSLTQDLTAAAGLPAYEVSNHARPGSESRHNQIYWLCGDYIGIGPGAHGRVTLGGNRLATVAESYPRLWLESVKENKGDKLVEELAPEDQANEYLMMGLRMVEGISISRFETLSMSVLDPEALDELTNLGMIHQDANRIRATDQGRMVLNAIIEKLLIG